MDNKLHEQIWALIEDYRNNIESSMYIEITSGEHIDDSIKRKILSSQLEQNLTELFFKNT